SSIARALRPEKTVDPPRAPLIVASDTKPREAEKPAAPIIVPWSQPSGPQGPVFAPPPADDTPDDAPPPQPDAPKPEPPPAAPPAAQEKPKADDPAPKPPAPPPPSSRQYKGPSEFELLKRLANTQDFGL